MNLPQTLFQWLSALLIGAVGYGIGLSLPVLVYALPILLIILAFRLIIDGGLGMLLNFLSPSKPKMRDGSPEPTYLITPGIVGSRVGLGQALIFGGYL